MVTIEVVRAKSYFTAYILKLFLPFNKCSIFIFYFLIFVNPGLTLSALSLNLIKYLSFFITFRI